LTSFPAPDKNSLKNQTDVLKRAVLIALVSRVNSETGISFEKQISYADEP